MATFEPPEDVESVAIYADNDKTYIGQKSAYQLAERLAAKKINVNVLISPVPGKDWLDELNSKQFNEVNDENN
jgi:hypothetical protein